MINGGNALSWLCAVVVLSATTAGAASESSGTPYQGIVDRNVFGLRPPPPPPSPDANKPPPPKIILTGITTILGNKRVLMKVQIPAKPGVKAEEQSMILAAGQRDGDVEVLEIDEKAGIVKVNDYGTITNLTWENNGIKVATAPPPVAAPPPVGQPNPAGGFTPGMPVPGMQPAAGRAVPTSRPMRTYSPAGGGVSPASYSNPSYSGGYGSPTYGATSPGSVTLPGLGAPASPVTASKNWPPEVTDPDHQTLLDAIYKQKNAEAIANGTMPDVPGSNPLVDTPTTSAPTTQNPRSGLPRAPSLPQLLPQ